MKRLFFLFCAMLASVPAKAQDSGASAIISFTPRKVVSSKVTGMADPFSKRALTPDDPVRIASGRLV
jgi:hypothetical protein